MKHKAGPNSPRKIVSIVVKRIPRINVPLMALLAINAADQTILQAAKMDEIREASDADLTLCQVKRLILDGWPKPIKSVPVEARAY